jgi:hypothetical protein
MRARIISLIGLLVLTTAYAVIRYVGFGGVDVAQVPAFILNKSISLASVVFLCLAAVMAARGRLEGARFWGSTFFHSAAIHIVLSLALLSPAYYPKFFGPSQMNWKGELVVLFGVLAAYLFVLVRRNINGACSYRGLLVLGTACTILHVVFMGIPSWTRVHEWHGGMPPISLLSCLVSVVALMFSLKQMGSGMRSA